MPTSCFRRDTRAAWPTRWKAAVKSRCTSGVFPFFHITLDCISVIMAFRPVCFWLPLLSVKLVNQSYMDTVVTGMLTLHWENPPGKKKNSLPQLSHVSGESTFRWLHTLSSENRVMLWTDQNGQELLFMTSVKNECRLSSYVKFKCSTCHTQSMRRLWVFSSMEVRFGTVHTQISPLSPFLGNIPLA